MLRTTIASALILAFARAHEDGEEETHDMDYYDFSPFDGFEHFMKDDEADEEGEEGEEDKDITDYVHDYDIFDEHDFKFDFDIFDHDDDEDDMDDADDADDADEGDVDGGDEPEDEDENDQGDEPEDEEEVVDPEEEEAEEKDVIDYSDLFDFFKDWESLLDFDFEIIDITSVEQDDAVTDLHEKAVDCITQGRRVERARDSCQRKLGIEQDRSVRKAGRALRLWNRFQDPEGIEEGVTVDNQTLKDAAFADFEARGIAALFERDVFEYTATIAEDCADLIDPIVVELENCENDKVELEDFQSWAYTRCPELRDLETSPGKDPKDWWLCDGDNSVTFATGLLCVNADD